MCRELINLVIYLFIGIDVAFLEDTVEIGLNGYYFLVYGNPSAFDLDAFAGRIFAAASTTTGYVTLR